MISLFLNIYIIILEKCTIKQNYGFGNCLHLHKFSYLKEELRAKLQLWLNISEHNGISKKY